MIVVQHVPSKPGLGRASSYEFNIILVKILYILAIATTAQYCVQSFYCTSLRILFGCVQYLALQPHVLEVCSSKP